MNNRIYGTVSAVALVAANVGWAGSPEPFIVAPPVVAAVLGSPFDGFYVGGAVTSISGTFSGAGDSTAGVFTFENDFDGIGGAVHAGYNIAPASVGFFYGGEIAYGMPNGDDEDFLTLDSVLTASGRVGYVAGPLMYFGKVGYAAGEIGCSSCGFIDGAVSGYVVGAGVEYMISNSLSVRGEYDYLDMGEASYSGDGYAGTTDLTASVLSVGLSYHF